VWLKRNSCWVLGSGSLKGGCHLENLGIDEVTPIGGRLVHETASYRCDTRGCVMQFWPPDDEHMCSKHVEAWNKTYCETNFVHQVG